MFGFSAQVCEELFFKYGVSLQVCVRGGGGAGSGGRSCGQGGGFNALYAPYHVYGEMAGGMVAWVPWMPSLPRCACIRLSERSSPGCSWCSSWTPRTTQ